MKPSPRRRASSGKAKALPKISVITPSLNQGRYLRQCLESVVSQGYKNLELLVIDGGSTDESLAVIRKYESAIEHWVSEPDQGQSDAINKGFAKATGEIVTWLNADDYYLPGALERVAEAYAADPAAPFYFGDGLRVDEAGVATSNFFPPDTLRFDRRALVMGLNYILQPSTFINRRFLEQVGHLDAGLHYGMDSDLWMRLSEVGEPRAIPAVLSATREYGTTKTAKGSFGRVEELRQIAMKHSGLPMTPGVLCYLLDTLHRFAQQEQDVFPASYVEDVSYFWNQTQQLLEPYKAAPDGFLRESEDQQTRMSLFSLYKSAVKQIDTLTAWVHKAHAANATLQNAMDEQSKAYAAQVEALTGHNTSAFGQVDTLTGWVNEARAANAALQGHLEELQKSYAAQLEELAGWNRNAASQIETLTGWVHQARADGAALGTEMGEQNREQARQIETLTGWVNEARGINATMRNAMDEQSKVQAEQIETLTRWVNEARGTNATLRKEMEEQRESHSTENASAVKQIETLTGWLQEARGTNATLRNEMDEQRKAHAAQSEGIVKQLETLTGWVQEAREANAALQKAMEEQKKVHVAEMTKAREASQNAMDEQKKVHAAEMAKVREANATLQKAMHEQALEMNALQDEMARPIVKLALGLSSLGGRRAKRRGDRR